MESNNFYKKVYNDLYSRGYHSSGFAGNKLLDFLVENYTLNANNKLLDIGCSNGTGVSKINSLVNSNICYGIDPADKAIQMCIKKNPNNDDRFKVGELPNIPFDDEYFDVIFSSDVIEHVLPEDIEESLQDIHRVTTEECNIFLNIALVPESHRPDNWKPVYDDNNLENLHVGLISSDEWIDKIKKYNFNIEKSDLYYERKGQQINNKDYSGQEGSLTLHLTK
tara:strand:+ start:1947 stop:2615 length:669 start_codon:yes stop_codon:yes gene_type:complete